MRRQASREPDHERRLRPQRRTEAPQVRPRARAPRSARRRCRVRHLHRLYRTRRRGDQRRRLRRPFAGGRPRTPGRRRSRRRCLLRCDRPRGGSGRARVSRGAWPRGARGHLAGDGAHGRRVGPRRGESRGGGLPESRDRGARPGRSPSRRRCRNRATSSAPSPTRPLRLASTSSWATGSRWATRPSRSARRS